MTIFLFPETRRLRYGDESAAPVFHHLTPVNPERDMETQAAPSETSAKSSTNATLEKVAAVLGQKRVESPTELRHNTGYPSRAQFSTFQSVVYSSQMLIRDVFTPIRIVTMPIVLWSALTLCFTTNCLLALNLTQSPVFSAPPYLFSTLHVGYVNFAFVVGGFIGLLTAGPFSDYTTIWATKRNNGIREPEMRFLAILPYIAICLIGMVVSSHWRPPPLLHVLFELY